MERELAIFKDTIWNSHRICVQRDAVLPNGVPDHIYNFPEEYNLEECGKDKHNMFLSSEKLLIWLHMDEGAFS